MLGFQALEIERLWNRDPGWFNTLPKSEQLRLYAWYRVRMNPVGQAKKAGRTSRAKNVKASKSGEDFWGV